MYTPRVKALQTLRVDLQNPEDREIVGAISWGARYSQRHARPSPHTGTCAPII